MTSNTSEGGERGDRDPGGGSASAQRAAAVEPLILGPIYQGLMMRYNSLTTTRWQTLALGLTAQGFVIGAASQVQEAQLPTAIMLAVVILFIGMVTIVTGQRFELVALADRHMRDALEERMLGDGNSDLRLHHALSTGRRGAAMLRGEYLREY